MKVRSFSCTLQRLALQHQLLLQATMLAVSLSAAASAQRAGRVPVIAASTFEACTTHDSGEHSSKSFLPMKLPLFLAVNVEEAPELFIHLYFQWINNPLIISFDAKDDDNLQLRAEASPSSFSIPVRNKGWISIILLPSGENALLLAVQSAHPRDRVVTVRSVTIEDFSHVAAGQLVNVTSNFSSAIDAKCLLNVADEASTEALVEESAQKMGTSLPMYVVVPVVVCVVFIVVIIALTSLFVWQRYELKKRKNSYQQTILRKQEELQQLNHTVQSNERPHVPPRTPYNSNQRISFHNSEDEECRQLRPTGSGSGSEMISVVVPPKPRTYVRDQSRQHLPNPISYTSNASKSEETKKQCGTFSKIMKGCSITSKNIPANKRVSESKELSCMNEKSKHENVNSREAEEEIGGFNGPYWHHSLRQPPSHNLKTFQV